MTRTWGLILLAVSLCVGGQKTVQAQERSTPQRTFSQEFYQQAIGGRFGAANGITYKYFLNESGHAIDGILNFQGSRNHGVFKLVGLYEIHNNIAVLDYQGLRWYYGAGAGVGLYDDKTNGQTQVALSADGVVGIDFKIPNSPINLSLDWKPMLELSPHPGMKFDGFGLSVRFVLF